MTAQLIVNNVLARKFPVKAGVRQGDPFSPILFLLTIQPLLNLLDHHKVFHHAHCDDMTIAVSSLNINNVIVALSAYDSASGAGVNFSKSTLISCTPAKFVHPFKTSKGDRYLGFWLGSSGRMSLLPGCVKDVYTSLHRIKKLHLSWAGKETILSSYFRPRYLYQMIFEDEHTKRLMDIEKWFLSSDEEAYDLSSPKASYPLSLAKMRHPYTRLRLKPLIDELDIRRFALACALLQSKFAFLLPGRLICGIPSCLVDHDTEGWNSLPAFPIISSSLRIINRYHSISSKRGKFRCLSISVITMSKKMIKKRMMQEEKLWPIPLSCGQEEYGKLHGTQFPIILRRVRKCKLRVAIISFGWKLLNRKAHISFTNDPCSFCGSRLSTKHILDGKCNALGIPDDLKGLLSKFLTPPHTNVDTPLLHIWVIWKTYWRIIHEFVPNKTPFNFHNILCNILTLESNRLLF
jgi:hypothetical protein